MPVDIDRNPSQEGELVTDELIEKALGPDEEGVRPRQPAEDEDEPGNDDLEITSEDEDLEDEELDHESEDELGEEDELDAVLDDDYDDELEEEDEELDDESEDDLDHDDEEEDLEDEEGLAESLTREELEEIRADPKLSKAYRSMQRAFTEKTEDVARRADEVELREASMEDFMDYIASPQGAIEFLKEQVIKNPEITGAAFEAVATSDESAEAFLVEAGLANPEALEAAIERIQELKSDEREMRLHERKRELDAAERKQELKARRKASEARRQRAIAIRQDLQKFAQREGIHEDDLPRLRQAVARVIQSNRSKDPESDITTDELRQVVKDFAADVEELRKRYTSEGRRGRKKKKRRKGSGSKGRSRNRAPKSGGVSRRRGARGSNKPEEPPPGVDPLDFAVERAADRHLA